MKSFIRQYTEHHVRAIITMMLIETSDYLRHRAEQNAERLARVEDILEGTGWDWRSIDNRYSEDQCCNKAAEDNSDSVEF